MAASTGPIQSRIQRADILPGKNNQVYIIDNRGVAMPLQTQVSNQPWPMPDDRDNFISWLRSEFAAANAIIDAFCHHLRVIGNAGEYDPVFASLQQRRYNWNLILHLQQYYSVSDIVLALQQVTQKKQQSGSWSVDQSSAYRKFEATDPFQSGENNVLNLSKRENMQQHTKAFNHIPPRKRISDQLKVDAVMQIKDIEVDQKGKTQVEINAKGELPGILEEMSRQAAAAATIKDVVECMTESKKSGHKDIQLYVKDDDEADSSSAACNATGAPGQKSGDWKKRHPHSNSNSNRFGLTSKKREGYISKSSSDIKNYLNSDDPRFAAMKVSNNFSCYEDFEGQLVNLVQGMELYEFVFTKEERTRMESLAIDCNPATENSGNDNQAPLQEIIDCLAQWHIIPHNNFPSCYSIKILDKGDSAIANISNMSLEQPIFLIPLLSECSLVVGCASKEMNSLEGIKDPFKLLLPLESVLVLQGNSASMATHTISAISEKCCYIILGSKAGRESSRSVSPTVSKPADSPSSSEVEAETSGKIQVPADMQSVGAASKQVPNRLVIPPRQAAASRVQTPPLQPLFAGSSTQPVGPYSPVTVLVPGWSPMPRLVRKSSAGTGVFLPSNSTPSPTSGPGRPPFPATPTISQRKQGGVSPPTRMQRTASSPAFFPSSTANPNHQQPSASSSATTTTAAAAGLLSTPHSQRSAEAPSPCPQQEQPVLSER